MTLLRFLCLLLLLAMVASCATTTATRAHDGMLVDPLMKRAEPIAVHAGQVWVIDVCASWSTPCLVNARVMSEVCEVLCDRADVWVASILLDDDTSQDGVRIYRESMGVRQQVATADDALREGGSVLGPLGNIPRLVIVDADGQIVEDITGGTLNAPAVIRRVYDVLGEDPAP